MTRPFKSFLFQAHLCPTNFTPSPHNCFLPFHCWQTLYLVNLIRGLSDVAQGKTVKLATEKQAAEMRLKQVAFSSLPCLRLLFLSALLTANVFLFPPAATSLGGTTCHTEISLGRHANVVFFAFCFSGVCTGSYRPWKKMTSTVDLDFPLDSEPFSFTVQKKRSSKLLTSSCN